MAADFPSLDFQDFHRNELPRRLAEGNGAIAARDDLARIGPLAFRLPEGDAYDGHEAGWVSILGKLDAHLASR